MNINYLTFILLQICLYDNVVKSSSSCGYDSCNPGKPDVLNVHIVAHTHDDVGWLKTVDQYYYGYKDDIQPAGVQYILDTVISALWENPKRRFSYVEMAFFYRWWKQQNNQVKLRVKTLVDEGRLQFLLGGWCMNDEATTHYTSIIDQMSLGLDFLNKTFGKCGRPLVSWQIDPFGHSIEQANIFAQMGFDALFFMRLDYRDKDQRAASKRLEFIQKGSFLRSGIETELFTNILYDTYCTPPGFCFDDKCSDDPIMDDPSLHDYNVKKRVDTFAFYVSQQAKAYQTNHILVPMGCDFQFQNAFHNFKNLDKLIYHVNRLRSDINVFYSTPACYALAVNNANKTFTVKQDDFFPYASGPNSYWTGYFSSRASLKGFVQYSNNIFQICKQLHVISKQDKIDLNRKVNSFAMKMGVLQHHDAVAGTEKQHVTYDYEERLTDGLRDCETVINTSLSKLISKENVNYDFILCDLVNISYCLYSDNMDYKLPLTVVVYNPLGETRHHWIEIPVNFIPGDDYNVFQSNGGLVKSQLIPISNRTKTIPERLIKHSTANYNLVFNSLIPPIGYSSYVIRRLKTSAKVSKSVVTPISSKENIVVQNNLLKLTYSGGFLTNILNLKSNISVNIKQDLRYYFSYQSDGQKSGAYIFRPTTNESLSLTKRPELILVNGNLVSEIHQKFSNWATLVTRLYNNSDKIETEWTVGPIPIEDSKGKEIVLEYQTDLETENKFTTDSNARQIILREINRRYDYKFDQTEPVSGNYYPINSHVLLAELKTYRSMIIYVDRAEGVGAYRNGMVELMLHRRTLFDDNFGVGEPLNETGADGNGLIVRGKHWIFVDNLFKLLFNLRTESLRSFNQPHAFFSRSHNLSKIEQFSALETDLPHGIHLLSLENHFNINEEIDYQIIRLENILDPQNVTLKIDLNKIFKNFNIQQFEELSLSANQYLKNVKRLKWNIERNGKFNRLKGTEVTLMSGEIRTFKVVLKSK